MELLILLGVSALVGILFKTVNNDPYAFQRNERRLLRGGLEGKLGALTDGLLYRIHGQVVCTHAVLTAPLIEKTCVAYIFALFKEGEPTPLLVKHEAKDFWITDGKERVLVESANLLPLLQFEYQGTICSSALATPQDLEEEVLRFLEERGQIELAKHLKKNLEGYHWHLGVLLDGALATVVGRARTEEIDTASESTSYREASPRKQQTRMQASEKQAVLVTNSQY